MASWTDVDRIASALPEAGPRSPGRVVDWQVKGKGFAWERPLRASDVAALTGLGAEVPDGPILAVRVADVGVKEALVGDDPDVYFTTPHFNGYPAVLVRLDRIGVDELEELIVEAWLDRAPKRLAREYLEAPK